MRRSRDFTSVLSVGTRARGGPLVVHQCAGLRDATPLVGLVVGKSVGGSVVRHRVARRLRAQLAVRLEVLPAGSGTVVRALRGAETATSAELGAGLDQALGRLAIRRKEPCGARSDR
jgi:ribonuclease P protein component